jgi:hypothetical protein
MTDRFVQHCWSMLGEGLGRNYFVYDPPQTLFRQERDSAVQKDFRPRRKGRPIYGPELPARPATRCG